MAWPNTPLTTYLAGGLPYIKAADLNSLQTGINGIINATYSLAAVVVDGTGGSVVVPVVGTAKVSATASAAGAGTAVAWGLMYKEAALFGHARVSDLGAFVSSYNGKSMAHPAAGVYEVTWNGAPTNFSRVVVSVTANPAVAAAWYIVHDAPFLTGADLTIRVWTFNTVPAHADVGFSITVWGG